MRNVLLVFVALLAPLAAAADIVVLRDGKSYEGKVTRQGDKVIVEMAEATLSFPADRVAAIAKKPYEPKPAEPAAPEDDEAGPTTSPQVAPPEVHVNLEQVARPETIVFLQMRRAAVAAGGFGDLQQWRAAVHDRKRNVGGNRWIAPEDFIRRRQKFEELAEQAARLFGEATSHIRARDAREKAERRRKKQLALRTTAQAARAPADPTVRAFLMGAAALIQGDHTAAKALFVKACRARPRVAGFHQGRGLALQGAGEPLEAVEAFTDVLRLRPDASQAVELLRAALKDAPGGQMDDPRFVAAQELLKGYKEDARGGGLGYGGGMRWLLPGEDARARENELPRPAFDRLDVRQGVAVPVAEHALLVSAQAVEGAAQVYVRIDEDTLAAGEVRRGTFMRRRAAGPAALVVVEDYTFEPVTVEPETPPQPGQACETRAVNLFEEMGRTPRPLTGKLLRAEGPPDAAATVDESAAGQDDADDEEDAKPPEKKTDIRTRIFGPKKKKETGPPLDVPFRLAAGESGAPVVTADGVLVGLLAGRTDPMAEGGGPHRLLRPADLQGVLGRLKFLGRRSRMGGFGRVQRDVKPQPAKGRFFIIRAICPERFGEEKPRSRFPRF